MSGISDDVRQQYAVSMAHNLSHAPGQLPEQCFATLCEMATVASKPYNPANFGYQGDTLDRYRNSVIGNFCESLLIYTLHEYGAPPSTIEVCRDYETQVTNNIDITCMGDTFQVKAARIGSFGSLFLSKADMDGSPDYVACVDAPNKVIYVVPRLHFYQRMLELGYDQDDLNKPREEWKHSYDRKTGKHLKGWWINDLKWAQRETLLATLTIPDYLSVPFVAVDKSDI